MSNHIIVTGFGRCGTTAMMRLLAHGGVPVAGNPPAYEEWGRADATWRENMAFLMNAEDKAVKVVDPLKHRLPATAQGSVIWMDRSPSQQAKSVRKIVETFGRAQGGLASQTARTDASHQAGLKRSLINDRPLAMADLRRRGPVLAVRFERMLKDPLAVAREVQMFLGSDVLRDPEAASRAIFKRDTNCLPDLAVEEALMMMAEAS